MQRRRLVELKHSGLLLLHLLNDDAEAVHALVPAARVRAPPLAILALLGAEPVQLLLARGDHAKHLVVAGAVGVLQAVLDGALDVLARPLLHIVQMPLLLARLRRDAHKIVVVAGVVFELLADKVDNVSGDCVQERAVVRHDDNALLVGIEELLQPHDVVDGQVVGWLIQQQHVGTHKQRLRQRNLHAPPAAQARGGRRVHLLGEGQPRQDLNGARLGRRHATRIQLLQHLVQLRGAIGGGCLTGIEQGVLAPPQLLHARIRVHHQLQRRLRLANQLLLHVHRRYVRGEVLQLVRRDRLEQCRLACVQSAHLLIQLCGRAHRCRSCQPGRTGGPASA